MFLFDVYFIVIIVLLTNGACNSIYSLHNLQFQSLFKYTP